MPNVLSFRFVKPPIFSFAFVERKNEFAATVNYFFPLADDLLLLPPPLLLELPPLDLLELALDLPAPPPEDFDDEPELLAFDALPLFDAEPLFDDDDDAPPLLALDEPDDLPLDDAPPIFPFDADEVFDAAPEDLEAVFPAEDAPLFAPDLPAAPLALAPLALALPPPFDDLLAAFAAPFAAPTPTSDAASFKTSPTTLAALPKIPDEAVPFEADLPPPLLLPAPPDAFPLEVFPLDEVVFFAVDLLFFAAIFLLSFLRCWN